MLRLCACAKKVKKTLGRNISQFEFMQVNAQGEICNLFFFFVITRYSVQLIGFSWIPEGIFHNEKAKTKVDTLPD